MHLFLKKSKKRCGEGAGQVVGGRKVVARIVYSSLSSAYEKEQNLGRKSLLAQTNCESKNFSSNILFGLFSKNPVRVYRQQHAGCMELCIAAIVKLKPQEEIIFLIIGTFVVQNDVLLLYWPLTDESNRRF